MLRLPFRAPLRSYSRISDLREASRGALDILPAHPGPRSHYFPNPHTFFFSVSSEVGAGVTLQTSYDRLPLPTPHARSTTLLARPLPVPCRPPARAGASSWSSDAPPSFPRSMAPVTAPSPLSSSLKRLRLSGLLATLPDRVGYAQKTSSIRGATVSASCWVRLSFHTSSHRTESRTTRRREFSSRPGPSS